MGKKVKGSTGRSRGPKRVPSSPSEAPSYKHLVWRFGRLDHETDFACSTLLGADVKELEAELHAFQREPIYELRRKGWLKWIGTNDMTPRGQTAVGQISKKQEDGLWQLHLGRHKWRIWGHFEEPEFFFLFWDPGHEIATGKSRHRRS